MPPATEAPAKAAREKGAVATKRDGEGPRRSLGWLHYVERWGPEGARWSQRYRKVKAVDDKSASALGLLRGGDLRRGWVLLDEIAEELRAYGDLEPSIRHVLERWYRGVVAFGHYLSGELDRAAEDLQRAEEAVVKAVERHCFLLPLANHCHEFRLHQARIERNRHRWDLMWEHLDAVRKMMEDRLPLCVLRNGERIYLRAVLEYFRSLPGGLVEGEREDLQGLLDRDRRLVLLDRFSRRVLCSPGFVITCP